MSVSMAAEELRVTQSAVSHQIKALELSISDSLFLRDKGKLRLSIRGASVYPVVAKAFTEIAAAFADAGRGPTVQLTVTCTPGILANWLTPNLGAFSAKHPHVRLCLIPSNRIDDLRTDGIDAHIRYGDLNWPGFVARKLLAIHLSPVCSPRLLARKPISSIGGILQQVILHADSGREWREWLLALGQSPAIDGPQHFLSDAHLAMEAAIYGNGIALADRLTASLPIAEGRLIRLIDAEVLASRSIYLISCGDLHSRPFLTMFTEWLETSIEATLAAPAAV